MAANVQVQYLHLSKAFFFLSVLIYIEEFSWMGREEE